MNKKIVSIALISFPLVFIMSTLSYQAEEMSTSDVLKQIGQKIENIDSYRIDYKVFLKKDDVMELFTQGDIAFKKPDMMLMKASLPGEDEPLQILISDGRTLWQYLPRGRMASKIDLNQLKQEFQEDYIREQIDISQPLRGVKEDSINFLGIREIRGEEVYLFEANISQEFARNIGMGIYSVKTYIAKKDGIVRQISYYNLNEKELMRHVYQNIRINVEFPDDYFLFRVSEDVHIIDMTESTIEAIKKNRE